MKSVAARIAFVVPIVIRIRTHSFALSLCIRELPHMTSRGGSGYAAKQIWLMAHHQTLATAYPASLAKNF